MRSYVDALVEPGEYLTANEINDELRSIVGDLHSVDRDNLSNLASEKFALGAWGNILVSASEQRIDVTLRYGPDTFDSGEIHPIPFDVVGGEVVPWREVFETGDCDLEVSLSVSYTDDVDGLESFIWVGIRVDGILVTRAPTSPESSYQDCSYTVWTVPVGAGEHVIEAVYGRPFHNTTRTCSFTDRLMAVREISR